MNWLEIPRDICDAGRDGKGMSRGASLLEAGEGFATVAGLEMYPNPSKEGAKKGDEETSS